MTHVVQILIVAAVAVIVVAGIGLAIAGTRTHLKSPEEVRDIADHTKQPDFPWM